MSSFAKASAYYSSYAQLAPLESPVTHTWVFTSANDSKLCDQCDGFRGESYELEDPSELEEAFPYGEQVDSATFACNIHPNCRCVMERVT